jgi:subfamily B ATP-binding cassette protein MsbA
MGRPHRALLVRAFGCMAVLGLTTGLYAWLLGPALRFVLSGGREGTQWLSQAMPWLPAWSNAQWVWALPALIIVIGLVKGVAYLGQFYFAGLYGQQVVGDLRAKLFAHFLTFSPTQLSQQRTGDLLSRFTADVAAVEQAATYTLASWFRDGFLILVLAGVCVALSWKLAAGTALIFLLIVLPAWLLTRKVLGRLREAQKSMGLLAAQVQEGVGAMRTLQIFNAQAAEKARFEHRAAALGRSLVKAEWDRALIPSGIELLGAAAIAFWLAVFALTRWIEPEALVSFLGALILLYQPAKDLGRVSQFAVGAVAALERIDEVLALPSVSAAGVDVKPVSREIRFEAVRFRYGDRQVFKALSFDLPVGKVVALVGESGGGKSTLVRLLLRFEQPFEGRVLLDNVDIRTASLKSLRPQFALVTQEPLLFDTTLAANLRVAKPQATDEELETAARVAQAHEFIAALPKGYQTPIGERGVTLSGGQKQRLCLARAVLANARVLVLDEATSNLDAQGEREVEAALKTVLQGRTVLMIAHRLSSIVNADRIDVLGGGRIVESGVHAQLLKRGGVYARLWEQQQGP